MQMVCNYSSGRFTGLQLGAFTPFSPIETAFPAVFTGVYVPLENRFLTSLIKSSINGVPMQQLAPLQVYPEAAPEL